MNLIIESQYFAPVISFQISTKTTYVEFDIYDRFQKMSFRNRTVVIGGNGPILLSVPLVDGREQRRPLKEVRIDHFRPWQAQHFKTLVSCYNRSPWFQFYEHELAALYEKKYEYLVDWNLHCFDWVVRKIGLVLEVGTSQEWIENYDPSTWIDLRNRLRPQTINEEFSQPLKYAQVFEDRLGFIPHCSILDLLFCEGKNAGRLLTGT